jgi:uridine kinase
MIRIEIRGATASGKTTLALAIQQLLRENNFTHIEQTDYDVCAGMGYDHLQDKRLDAIKDQTIQIVTYNDNAILRDF